MSAWLRFRKVGKAFCADIPNEPGRVWLKRVDSSWHLIEESKNPDTPRFLMLDSYRTKRDAEHAANILIEYRNGG